MWNPARDRMSEERPSPPRVLARPPSGRTLVLAPHPDDETFGMGGTLRLHVEQGDRVDVIFLTSGGFGDPDGLFADQDYPTLRRAEAERAGRILGVEELVFYAYPDHYPTITEEALDDVAGRLVGDVVARDPAHLYFPWPGDSHPDHWATARAVLRALPRLPPTIRAVGYEVWSPLVPDFVVDVTATREVKLAAGRCYESQLRYTAYLPITDGLMTYRSLHFKPKPGEPPRYGEAFVEIARS
jgi:LmbE family N-acetylglucosaminyl deacetylase